MLARMLALLPLACSGPDDADRDRPAPPTPAPTGDTAPAPVPGWIDRFRAELEADGLVLAEGRAGVLDPAECCSWESCYMFNPDNDYIGWWLPPGPGQTASDRPSPSGIGSLAWRLRSDEAVIGIGRTPPAGAYFSYRSYVHDRYYPLLGAREWLFYNLGDSLNQFVIGAGEGGPFDADFVLMTTPHAGTEARIRAAAARAGIPDGIVNTDAIGGTPITLGLHQEADTFRMQARMALFADPVAGQAYVDDPPVTVWRVTPADEVAFAPIAVPPFRPRGTGTDESAWASAMEELDVAVRAAHLDYVPHPLPTVVTSTDEECPPGCNRDTFFAVAIHYLLPVDGDGFVMVYGVNHERTGKSVYSNFSVIEVEQLSAVAAVHSGQMPGSAAPYLPGHPQVDDLYAWKIARTCDPKDPWCIEVPTECPGWDSAGEGSIAYRAYTEAATATGPSSSELVVDRAILFTRPTPAPAPAAPPAPAPGPARSRSR
jgi:hypothetical protein